MSAVSTRTVTSFTEEAQILLKIAANLGKYRFEDRKEEFLRSLGALGMEAEEALSLWDSMVVATNGPSVSVNGHVDVDWVLVKSNTCLADRLGISLNSEKYPRNLLLYRLMELHFPDFFAVEVNGTVHMGGKDSKGNPPGRRLVCFPKQPAGPALNGDIGPLSAHRLLRGIEPSQFSARVQRAAAPLCSVLGDDLGLRLTELMLQCQMEIPSTQMARSLESVLSAGMGGEALTLVGAFCPDYAYEETGDPHLPYRYTFDGLGDGVGLVARQFARIVPTLSGFLTELGIQHRIVLGIGDFEADSEDVLKRVRLTREEFLARCERSLQAFAEEVPAGLPLELEMFDRSRGNGRLRSYAADACKQMQQGRFGTMRELHADLDTILARIPNQYRTFYERWYDREMTDGEVSNLVYSQGSEYASTARIYHEDFGSNVIMLAGDRPEMHRFNAFYCVYPTLCAKRAY